MAGKPWIVAILAAMVVSMIGAVFLQKGPEGYTLSGLLRIADGEEELLEEKLRQEAEAELAAKRAKDIEAQSLKVVRTSQQGKGGGIEIALQAQGANSRTAMDYLNALMVRYARREGKTEELVKTQMEISEAERKLEAALKAKEKADGKIEENEKEIHQLLERERIEAARVAQQTAPPEPKITAPSPAPALVSPKVSESNSGRKKPERELEEPQMPELEETESFVPKQRVAMAPAVSQPSTSPPIASPKKAPKAAPAQELEEPVGEPMSEALSEVERGELAEELKILKTERVRLIKGGRRAAHPEVQNVEQRIREIESQLAPASGSGGMLKKVKFEYVTEAAKDSAALIAFRNMRMKLQKEVESLKKKRNQAADTIAAQKALLVKLVARHGTLEATFKPVVIAPAKVIAQIDSPFPIGRLVGTLVGSLIAGMVGFGFAKWGEERKVITSISEAEQILRMPVQSIDSPKRRRAA